MEKLIKNTISHEAFFMVNKVMLKYLGSANAAIILSGFISKYDYFQKRNEIVDGFFYNTKEMIMQETGMSEAAILRAEAIAIVPTASHGLRVYAAPRKRPARPYLPGIWLERF